MSSQKNSIYARHNSRELSFSVLLVTKRISASIVARNFSCQQFYDPPGVHSLLDLTLSSLSKSTISRASHFVSVSGGEPSIVHLSSISRQVHFIFANGDIYIYRRLPGEFMNNPHCKGSAGAREISPTAKSTYVRPVLHATFYDRTWPRDKSGGKHIEQRRIFFDCRKSKKALNLCECSIAFTTWRE